MCLLVSLASVPCDCEDTSNLRLLPLVCPLLREARIVDVPRIDYRVVMRAR